MLKALYTQKIKKLLEKRRKSWWKKFLYETKETAKKVEDGTKETLTYYDFLSEHEPRIRTNNVMERLNREFRRRTRMGAAFRTVMLICAQLRHVVGLQWGARST